VTTPLVLPFDGVRPDVDAKAWIAPTAVLVGGVHLGEEASVWYSAVLRGDRDSIAVGAGSNIQDGCVLHTDPGFPVRVGSGVSVGHRAVVHGCTVGDDVLVGMGAVVLNGARVGSGTLIAAGAVVLEGADIPPGSLVAGVPGKVRRGLTDDERAAILTNAATYRELAAAHARSIDA
jgi:carbonic anhydrase/acetyltransferase-like protein (isoleucine patch superfamily)